MQLLLATVCLITQLTTYSQLPTQSWYRGNFQPTAWVHDILTELGCSTDPQLLVAFVCAMLRETAPTTGSDMTLRCHAVCKFCDLNNVL